MIVNLLEGLANARDVGGLRVQGGGRTRFGVLFRSDAPIVGDGEPALFPWPPSDVIDLRSPDDEPLVHPLIEAGATVHSFPILPDADPVRLAAGQAGDLTELYRAIVDERGALLAEVAETVASASGSCLVHCAAGKDRTGVVIAVLLAAVGVGRADIVGDYERTAANMPTVFARITSVRSDLDQALIADWMPTSPGGELRGLLSTDAAAIEAVLDAVEESDGGAAGWLAAQGLPADKMALLRNRLVTSPRD